MFSNISTQNVAKIAIMIMTLALVSCNKAGTGAGDSSIIPNFRLSLTDAPNGSFDSVKVKISSVDLVLTDSKKTALVPLTQGSGVVDLLSLQNGVTMPMGDLQLPKGVKIKEVHFHLSGEGHEGVRTNGKKCKLPTTCAGGDVYKITLDKPIEIGDDEHSHLVLDFNAHQSIIDNDDSSESCNFKPSISVKSAGIWKAEKRDDDDFNSKGKGLNNFEAVKNQIKKFGKNHDSDEKENDDNEENQCVSILNPTTVIAPAPVGPVAPPAPVVTPVIVPTAVPNFFGAA